ncbi:hypothetical protein [Amycolatopsis carbonis]|uniref:hypothetical protein n=1 Tax=Amycolatopsis carbonis TaxID=715471 RepID=UPI0033406226
MALTSITVTTGTVVAGRALARNGQVSLDDNTFTTPDCDTTTPTTDTTPTTSDTDTTSPTTTTATTDSSSGATETTTSSGGLGASWTDSGSNGSGPGPADFPTGPSHLASTGASPLLGPALGLGFLLVVLGGSLLFVLRARKFRRRSE